MKKFEVKIMGGLGNQMFEYATLRYLMLEHNGKGILSKSGITNIDHNVYSLEHFNINNDLVVANKSSIKMKIVGKISDKLYNTNNREKLMKFEKILNHIGIYLMPNGNLYIPLNKSYVHNNSIVGYFQSSKYFEKYSDVIRKELKVKDPIKHDNIKLLNDIKKNNSVCVHIRRGDYVGNSKFEVCNEKYYQNAVLKAKRELKNPKFYIFSDDIEFVKNNYSLDCDCIYITGNNSNYEELRLMYSCKNFIISNSTFSWWAQFLSDNDEKKVYAPNKWTNLDDYYDIKDDSWIFVDVAKDDI